MVPAKLSVAICVPLDTTICPLQKAYQAPVGLQPFSAVSNRSQHLLLTCHRPFRMYSCHFVHFEPHRLDGIQLAFVQAPCLRSANGILQSSQRCQAHSSSNGSISEAERTSTRHCQSEVAELQKEVSELRQLVAAQSKLVKDQVMQNIFSRLWLTAHVFHSSCESSQIRQAFTVFIIKGSQRPVKDTVSRQL